jgi:hypothetical protein
LTPAAARIILLHRPDLPAEWFMQIVRYSVRRLAIALGVALGLAVVIGVLHHHGDLRSSESCAICSLSNTPATAICSIADGMPALRCELVIAPPPAAPPAVHATPPSSRSPPSV